MMTKLKKYQLFKDTINSVNFLSKSKEQIVCSGEDGIYLFSIKTGTIVWTSKDCVENISCIAVSPNDDIVAGGGVKERLFVINAASGKTICSIYVGSEIWRVLFLSQQKIACGLENGTVAIIYWQTQKIEKKLKVGVRTVYALAISPVNFDVLLTGDNFGVIKQTIISSEKTVMVYEGHTNAVFDLNFLSFGNMFVSGSGDHTARLFALDQKQSIRMFKGHSCSVLSVSLIHDDELLVTTSYDDTVKLWKIGNGECLTTVKADVYCGTVSKDEQSLIVGGYEKVMLFSCPPRSAVSLDRKLKLSK